MNIKRFNGEVDGKIHLRIDTINQLDKACIRVLECYSGNGLLWSLVKDKTEKDIQVLRIDKSNDREGFYLKGDCLKFLKTLDLSKFDIIDLDAFGIPYDQLMTVIDRGFKGIVHVTMIQRGFGSLPKKMLIEYGYTGQMISKSHTLFTKHAFDMMKIILAKRNIKQVVAISKNERTNYFYFKLG